MCQVGQETRRWDGPGLVARCESGWSGGGGLFGRDVWWGQGCRLEVDRGRRGG